MDKSEKKTFNLSFYPIATAVVLDLGEELRKFHIPGYYKLVNEPQREDLLAAVQDNLRAFAYRYLHTDYDKDLDPEDPEDFVPFFDEPVGRRVMHTSRECPDPMEAVHLVFGPGHAITYSEQESLHKWSRFRTDFPNAVGYIQHRGRNYAILKI